MKTKFTFIMLMLTTLSSLATNYYVSTTGNDANPGTLASPWRNVNYAVNFSGLTGGDFVIIRGGTYNERVIMNKSGTAGNNITVTKYTGETPIIEGTGISWPWTNGGSGLFQIQGSYIVIDGISVKNATSTHSGNGDVCGIHIHGPGVSFVTIRNCYTEHTQSSGISCWGNSAAKTYTGATDILIENNEIVNAVNDGYQENLTIAGGVDRFEVRYNKVHDCSQTLKPRAPNITIGIDSKVNVRNGKVHHNTVYNINLGGNGIYVDAWDDHAYNIDIYNNIVYNADGSSIVVGGEEGGESNNINVYNNLVYGGGSNGLKLSAAYSTSGTTPPNIHDVKWYNNTVYNCAHASAIVEGNTGIITWKNNIFSNCVWNNGVYVFSSNKSNVIVEKNIIWQFKNRSWSSPQMEELKGTSPIELDPLFINAAGNNFHLQAGSPAIDAATTSLVPLTDLDDNNRPAGAGYDIGAYEYGSTVSTTPTVSIVASTANASETGPTNGVYTVSRTGSTIAALTVNYTISGTASLSDYQTLSGSIIIPATASSATINLIPVDDAILENPENVTLTISTNANYLIDVAQNNATVAIADNDYLTACKISSVPVIDGLEENIWDLIRVDSVKNIIIGTATPTDLSATYKVNWNSNSIFIFIKVKDDFKFNDSGIAPWDDDAIEVFIDGNNEKTTSYDANDHQLYFRWNDNIPYEYSGGLNSNPAGISFAQTNTVDGYQMEIKIDWTAIGATATNNKLIGIDVQINDDDDGSLRESKMTAFALADVANNNPSVFGTMKLDAAACNVSTEILENTATNDFVIYPNPANDLAVINYQLLENSFVKISICDVLGKEVMNVANEKQNAGEHQLNINTSQLQNGIYFVQIKNGEASIFNKKLVINN